MRQVRRGDSCALVVDNETQTARFELVCHRDRGSWWRILRGIFQYMSKRGGHQTRIDMYSLTVRLVGDPDLVRTQRVLNLPSSHLNNCRWMHPLQRGRDLSGVDAGHVENVLKEPGQPLESC